MYRLAMVFVMALASCVYAGISPDPIAFGEASITIGATTLHVQVARTPSQMERGLMYRDSVAPFDGMLFIFNIPQPVSFWMKDTRMPLEIGYFDYAGKLVETHSMQPLDTTPTPSRSHSIRYALELPDGDFARLGLKLGDKLTFPSVAASLDSSLPNF